MVAFIFNGVSCGGFFFHPIDTEIRIGIFCMQIELKMEAGIYLRNIYVKTVLKMMSVG